MTNTSLLHLFLEIVVIGLVVWLIQAYTPIPDAFKKIVLVIGIVFVLILALAAFGVHL